jgi:hypothetical protein
VDDIFTVFNADQFLASKTFKSSEPSDELYPIQFSRFKTQIDVHFEYQTLHKYHEHRKHQPV